MANTLRIKRRAVGGAAGAPGSLQNGELAFNEQDNTLYYGFGSGGTGGSATQVVSIAGNGAFATINTNQRFTGVKTFDQSPLVPTLPFGTNTLAAASTAFVQAAISAASIPDGDKGDITVSGNGSSWTIDANVVTNDKLATMAANTLKGRTGSTGGPNDLTVAQVKTMLAISNVDNTSDANKPVSTATQTALDAKVSTSLLGVPNGVATLNVDGKLNANQVNALAIGSIRTFASQAAMLAWTDAEEGDVAVRTDISKTFMLSQTPPGTLANWIELLNPTSPVTSVFNRTGAVVAATGDYSVAQITGAAPIASPAFTGTPTGPTAAVATNNTQLATTAYVKSQGYTDNTGTVTSIGLSGGTTGMTFSAAITSAGTITMSGTLGVANGGTGATTAAAARTNLGLGSMATQNSNAVSITGGTIDNIDLDGGTF